jgi:hypothetical protein
MEALAFFTSRVFVVGDAPTSAFCRTAGPVRPRTAGK